MSAIPSKIELCDNCKTAVHHSGGQFAPNFQLSHIDPRREPIRLCLGCYFGYKGKYTVAGWEIQKQEK
jgi:hypothetical protein